MILDCFEHAFYINLDTDIDRNAKVLASLSDHNISAERYPGIVDKDPRIGCKLSHLKIINESRKRGLKNVLVFEDDAIFKDDFEVHWSRIKDKIKRFPYDIFYFYLWNLRDLPPCRLCRIQRNLWTHAYAVNSKYFEQYINIIKTSSVALDLIWHPKKSYLFAPTVSLIGQDAGYSRITGEYKPLRFT